MNWKPTSLLDRLGRAANAGPRQRSSVDVVGASLPGTSGDDELTVFIVAGEHSGDALGAGLMSELLRRRRGRVRFIGVGGEAMEAVGMTSLFPLGDIAVMGPVAILKSLPRLTDRVYRTVGAGVACRPDVIVIIDAPEFTHRVAARLKRKLPLTPVIDYVCPSVWAWRSGRARTMARSIDHVLALLPFEPEALERLAGPPATYVGHPLAERQQWIKARNPAALADRLDLDPDRLPLVVLPGSRRTEVSRLLPVFCETVNQMALGGRPLEVIIPCVPHLRAMVEDLAGQLQVPWHLVEGDDDKFTSFRLARAALAASGTVTLELALAGTPMVVAYRVDGLAAHIGFMIKVPSIVLANLVLGDNAFPEFVQDDCTVDRLAPALEKLLDDTPERAAQLEALSRISARMELVDGLPSERAADVVLAHALPAGKPIA